MPMQYGQSGTTIETRTKFTVATEHLKWKKDPSGIGKSFELKTVG